MSLRRKLPPNTRDPNINYGENMQGSNVELFAMHIRSSRSLTFVSRSQAEGELVAGRCLFEANEMSYKTRDSEHTWRKSTLPSRTKTTQRSKRV